MNLAKKKRKEELSKIIDDAIEKEVLLKKDDWRRQFDAYSKGIDYFKNQVWVVITSGFALFGAILWIFEKFGNVNGGDILIWKIVTAIFVLVIAFLVIMLIWVFYSRIKKSREYIKRISKKCGHIDIDEKIPYFSEYIFDGNRILKFLDKKAQYKPLIEKIFSILIFITAIILIFYIMLSVPILSNDIVIRISR